MAGSIEYLLVCLEDAIGEVGLAQELPEVLDGVQFGRSRWQEEQSDVLAAEVARCLSGIDRLTPLLRSPSPGVWLLSMRY